MKSHEYAEKVKAAADFLLAREDVEFVGRPPFIPISFYDKEPFIAAVRVFGSGEKKWTHDELQFTPHGAAEIFRLYIARNVVGRWVRPAEDDAEPLLSEEEVATL